MAQITLKGNPINTKGNLPETGTQATDFSLVASDLSKKSLADFQGKKKVLNIFPSVDTGTCAASVRRFNQLASEFSETVVINISRDLPFAQNRFCGAEGLDNVINLSDFVEGQFGKDYGLIMVDGPLSGLLSRCVIILDAQNKVIYTEQVSEIADEPNYEKALEALK